jgi:hypothetical protein
MAVAVAFERRQCRELEGIEAEIPAVAYNNVDVRGQAVASATYGGDDFQL